MISALILHYDPFLNTKKHNFIHEESRTKNEDCDGEGHVKGLLIQKQLTQHANGENPVSYHCVKLRTNMLLDLLVLD